MALKPDYSKARWGSCTAALPILYAEESEIAAQRADYERRLRALRAAYDAGHIPGDLSKGLGMAQPFFLAYQGQNDRELQSLFGGLASRIMAERYGTAELAPPPAPGEPVRVGIVSGFFYQHSVWKIGVKGWVSQLDPKRFQVFGYSHSARSRMPKPRSRGSTATASCRAQTRPNTGGRPSSPTGRTFCIYPDIGMSTEAVGAGGAPPRPGAMRLHRPSADQRLSDHRLFPQRRTDRARQTAQDHYVGKAGEASQHRLSLRAAGARRRRR